MEYENTLKYAGKILIMSPLPLLYIKIINHNVFIIMTLPVRQVMT